jgi:hypothetical protein
VMGASRRSDYFTLPGTDHGTHTKDRSWRVF